MKRRSLLLLGALTPIALFSSRFLGARASKASPPPDYRELTQRLNEFATNIQTPADARRLVDFIAELFSKETPSAWNKESLRSLIAQAEFSAVSDPQKLIPEPRLAEAWNTYVDTIQAPEDQKVTPAELHNLRDAFLTSARLFWDRGHRNIWTVPSIYATVSDGQLAPGCRAVESIRVLWDLAKMPDNLKGARDRVSKGLLTSELFRKPQQSLASSASQVRLEMRTSTNPIEIAQRNYVTLYGEKAFRDAVSAMLNETLS